VLLPSLITFQDQLITLTIDLHFSMLRGNKTKQSAQNSYSSCILQKKLWNQNTVDYKQVKWSRYRPGVAQRVGRGIALLFDDRGTRRGWVVRSTPRSHFIPGKDPVLISQEAGWAPSPVWTGRKSRPHRNSILNRPARSQSLHWATRPTCRL